MKWYPVWLALWMGCTALPAAQVLMVADEIPAMEVLAAKLKEAEGITSQIVKQADMPASLAPYRAVFVYIHLKLQEPVERALIEYARAGGRLIPLHHSISSGKRKNPLWFDFLGIKLPEVDVAAGGYKWIEPVTLDFVKVADHFITTNQVSYPDLIFYAGEGARGEARPTPGFTLRESEVYLNHTFAGPRVVLLGMRYQDAKSGQVWMQDRTGWLRTAGKGWIIYFMPGHSARDFENAAYARILANAVIWRPG